MKMQKNSAAGLWRTMVFILAAAIFAVGFCTLWFQQTQLAYNAGCACVDTEYKALALMEELNTSPDTDEEIYLRAVNEYNKGRFSNATATAVVELFDYSEETGSYTRSEVIASTAELYEMEGQEDVNPEFALAAAELEWYIENTFAKQYYPTYLHYRMTSGQNYAAQYSIAEEREDGSALAVASVYTFSLPQLTWRYLMRECSIPLAALFLLCFGGAAVIVITEKKYLQSP